MMRSRVLFTVLFVAALSGLMALSGHDAAASGHLAAKHSSTFLGLNWWSSADHRAPMGWFIVDFVLFLAALVGLSTGPLRRAFGERHDTIRRTIADAAVAHAKASHAQQEARRKLGGLEAEITGMERTSHADGEAERAQLIREGEERVQQMRRDAQLQDEQAKRRSIERLRHQSLRMVLAAAHRKVDAALTLDDQQRLLDAAISELATLPARAITQTEGSRP